MIEYSLNDKGIFYVRFIGKITTTDIHNYLNDFEKLDDLPRKLLALYDLRETNLKLALKEIDKLAKQADEVTIKFASVKTAFLVNDPNLTAYALLFNQATERETKEREVFSTEESANLWLLSK